MLNRLRGFLLGFVIWFVYRLLSLTWKIKIIEPESMKSFLSQKQPIILSHFHGDELALVSLVPRYRIATMTSTSKDGELMNTVLHLLGGKTSRGSSTRGGVSALKGLIKHCRDGSNCSVAVDGPKGPVFEVKPGVFELARLMKAPIFAAGIFCNRFWFFPKSWNQAYLPKPFAQVFIIWTPFLEKIDKDLDPRSPELANALKNQLFDARRQASKFIAGSSSQI